MKRLCAILILTLTFTLTFAVIAFAEEDTTPTITASGVSIRIPNESTSTKGGLRFKMKVDTPANGVEVVEQGTLIIPFYVVGENDLNLDTSSVLKVVKSENEYYSYDEDYYEFIAVLTDIPVYNLKSTICARGYVTYTVDGGDTQTVYSDTVIYDIYSIAEKVMASETEKDETKLAVDEFIIDSYDKYAAAFNDAEEGKLTITSPASGEEVYPYEEPVKDYLLEAEGYLDTIDPSQGECVDIEYEYRYRYYSSYKDANRHLDSIAPIKITWENQYDNVASFTVMYATEEDFSDAKYAYASASSTSVELYNLFKATDYYVKIIANMKNGTTYTTTSTFSTTDLGPRVIHLHGSANIRDIGGYMTTSGYRTLQGMIYRGGQMDDVFPSQTNPMFNTELTAYGKYVAQNELGIKVDLDFRSGFVESPIPGAERKHIPVIQYNIDREDNREYIRQTFSMFSNINNYPIIFHCQGGADRTGTIAYLLNALLGVSEKDIIRDYEFTSFSIYDVRSILSESYINRSSYGFYTTLDAQEGDTLQKRVENYLLGCGVTEEEIENIRSIMFTGKVNRSVSFPTELRIAESTALKIEVNGNLDEISNVYINDTEVKWTEVAGGIAIDVIDFPSSVTSGEVTVKVAFTDGQEKEGTFIYDKTRTITVCDSVSKAFDIPLTITVGAAPEHISEVYVGGYKVEYELEGKVITVPIANLPEGLSGDSIAVKVVFVDNEELTGTFSYDSADIVDLGDYMEDTTLDVSTSTLTATSTPVGYGKWVRMHLDATSNETGDIRVMIGSYGAQFRSDATRYLTLNTSGTWGTNRPGHNAIDQETFAEDNSLYLYIKVELVNDTAVRVSLVTTDQETNTRQAVQAYEYTRLTSGEITHDNACVMFSIDAGADTTKLVINGTATVEEEETEKVYAVEDYLNFGDSKTIALNPTTNASVTSSAIGYGKWIKVHFEATPADLEVGNHYIFVGSYGTRLRGNQNRVSTLTSSGEITQIERVESTGIDQRSFQTGVEYDYYVRVDLLNDTTARLTQKMVHRTTGEEMNEFYYDITRLTSGEIADEDACVTIMVGSDTTSLIIYDDRKDS